MKEKVIKLINRIYFGLYLYTKALDIPVSWAGSKDYYRGILRFKLYDLLVMFYANAFIRSNVLKIFKQRNISKDTLDIIKYNISSILECIEMNKDYYAAEYFPELKNDKKLSRRSSVETAKIFRKEFNIKEEDLNEDVLIDTLNNNNNDIYQTFQIIYGK